MRLVPYVIKAWKPIVRKWIFEYKQYASGHMKKKCYGFRNADKTFYLISLKGRYNGLFTGVAIALADIDYAIKNQWIPVIEAKGEDNPLWVRGNNHVSNKENTWEHYFEQPNNNYLLKDVYSSKNVFTSWQANRTTAQFFSRPDIRDFQYLMDEGNLTYWSDLYKKYVRYMPEIQEKLLKDSELLNIADGKILGVMLRLEFAWGAAGEELLYNNHPKVPSILQMIELTEDYMKKWGCNYIFVSGDCREVIDAFKEKFLDKCIIINRKLNHLMDNGEWLKKTELDKINQEFDFNDENWQWEKTVDYLREVNMLAQCDCFLGSRGSGASFAFIINGGKYENYKIWDEGTYKLK